MPPRAAAAPATAFGSFGFSTSAFAPASSTPRSPRASHLICHAAVASSPCAADPVSLSSPKLLSRPQRILPRITGPPPPPPLGPPRHLTHRNVRSFTNHDPPPPFPLHFYSLSKYMYIYIYILTILCTNNWMDYTRYSSKGKKRKEKKRVFPPRCRFSYLIPRLIVPSGRDEGPKNPNTEESVSRGYEAHTRLPRD